MGADLCSRSADFHVSDNREGLGWRPLRRSATLPNAVFSAGSRFMRQWSFTLHGPGGIPHALDSWWKSCSSPKLSTLLMGGALMGRGERLVTRWGGSFECVRVVLTNGSTGVKVRNLSRRGRRLAW
jgi:hypothetical protein